MKFLAGNLCGALIALAAVYVVAEYSYLPEIFVITNSEERSRPRPFLNKQFYQAMEAQRKRIYQRLGEMPSLPPSTN